MSLAEQKVELMQLVVSADEEMTAKLITLAKQLIKTEARFTPEELAKFHATRQKYLDPESKTILLEGAHAYIRNLKTR